MKEFVEFIARLGGGITSSLEQILFDYLATRPELVNNPLFQRANPNLPAWSNFLVSLGFNVLPWAGALLGEEDAYKKGDKNGEAIAHGVRTVTEGGVLYTVPRLVRIPEVNVASGRLG